MPFVRWCIRDILQWNRQQIINGHSNEAKQKLSQWNLGTISSSVQYPKYLEMIHKINIELGYCTKKHKPVKDLYIAWKQCAPSKIISSLILRPGPHPSVTNQIPRLVLQVFKARKTATTTGTWCTVFQALQCCSWVDIDNHDFTFAATSEEYLKICTCALSLYIIGKWLTVVFVLETLFTN